MVKTTRGPFEAWEVHSTYQANSIENSAHQLERCRGTSRARTGLGGRPAVEPREVPRHVKRKPKFNRPNAEALKTERFKRPNAEALKTERFKRPNAEVLKTKRFKKAPRELKR